MVDKGVGQVGQVGGQVVDKGVGQVGQVGGQVVDKGVGQVGQVRGQEGISFLCTVQQGGCMESLVLQNVVECIQAYVSWLVIAFKEGKVPCL